MRTRLLLVLLGLLVGISAMMPYAANSPDAQSLSISFHQTALGDYGILFDWDYCNSKLEEGLAWVIIQNKIHVKSTVKKTSPCGGHITADELWMVDEDVDLVKAILCNFGPGTLYLKVKDAYGNEHMWSVPFAQIHVEQNRLYSSLKKEHCLVLPAQQNPYAYAEIPWTSPIVNIDAFLTLCPPEDELPSFRRTFRSCSNPLCGPRIRSTPAM